MTQLNTLTETKQYRAPPMKAANGHAEEAAPFHSNAEPADIQAARKWFDGLVRQSKHSIVDWRGQMTVAKAIILREHSGTNRGISRNAQERHRHDIKTNNWLPTNQGIGVDTAGVVFDGQHRVLDVIQTGVAIPMLICFGLEPRVQDVVDTHTVRTASGTLQIAGFKNAPALAAASRMIVALENKIPLSAAKIANREAVSFVENHPTLERAVTHGMSVGGALRAAPTPIVVGIYYISCKYPEVLYMPFLDKIRTGAHLDQRTPEYVLRRDIGSGWYINQFGRHSARTAVAAAIVMGWNLHRQGKSIQRIAWKVGEPFPQVI